MKIGITTMICVYSGINIFIRIDCVDFNVVFDYLLVNFTIHAFQVNRNTIHILR